MSQAAESDHFRLSVDTSRARKFSRDEMIGLKKSKSSVQPLRKDSFAGFKMNSARGKQDVEPISTFGGGFSMK